MPDGDAPEVALPGAPESQPSGLFCSGTSSVEQSYLALTPEDLVTDFRHRRLEITSTLSRDWTSPAVVRRLKQELEELQGSMHSFLGQALHDSAVDGGGAAQGDRLPRRSAACSPRALRRIATARVETARPGAWRAAAEAGREPSPRTPRRSPRQSPRETTPERPEAPGAAGKGGGKGKSPPPPPPPKGKGKGSVSPGPAAWRLGKLPQSGGPAFGRRLHWQPLAPERLPGTVWADGVPDEPFDLEVLGRLFGKVQAGAATKVVVKLPQEVELLPRPRAQNIMITLRKQPLTEEVHRALKTMDLEGDVVGADGWDLLRTVVPSLEEVRLLAAFRGDCATLRLAEREVMPLAQLQSPTAAQRVQLFVFHYMMEGLTSQLQTAFATVSRSCTSMRSSAELRTLLLQVRAVGNALNFGLSAGAEGARGFALEVLPRLMQCKATSRLRISMLHLVLTRLGRERVSALLAALGCITAATEFPLMQLAADVEDFQRKACQVRQAVEACGGARAAWLPPQAAAAAAGAALLPPRLAAEAAEAGSAAGQGAAGATADQGPADSAGPGFVGGTPGSAAAAAAAAVTVEEAATTDAAAEVANLMQQPLNGLLRRAQAEAAALEEGLHAVRREAAAVLTFFAEQARPGELDGKLLDLVLLLRTFAADVRICWHDLVTQPDLAGACAATGPGSSCPSTRAPSTIGCMVCEL